MTHASSLHRSARATILAFLQQCGPATTRVISNGTGLPHNTVTNAVHRLGVRNRIYLVARIRGQSGLWSFLPPSQSASAADEPSSSKSTRAADELIDDAEHRAWMAYWRQRRNARLARQCAGYAGS